MLNRAEVVKYVGYETEANRMEFFYTVNGHSISVLLMAKRFQFPIDNVTDKIAYYLGFSYLIDIIHMTFPKKVEVMYMPPDREFWDYMLTHVVGEALIKYGEPISILKDIEFVENLGGLYYLPPTEENLEDSCLVPIGGGKDSIVTYELAKKRCSNVFTMSVQAPGHNWDEIAPMIKKLECEEMFDSYEDMNFLNRFQPITSGNAIFNYSMIALLVARQKGTKEIIFGNDKSVSNVFNYQGVEINHMFDKTKEFRKKFNKFISDNVVKGYEFTSLIEDMTGAEVAMELSKYHKEQYYEHLCSCNYANIKQHSHSPTGQCSDCLKCMYTYLCICNAGDKKYADIIFGDMSERMDLMKELLDDKFRADCFGDKEECKMLVRNLRRA